MYIAFSSPLSVDKRQITHADVQSSNTNCVAMASRPNTLAKVSISIFHGKVPMPIGTTRMADPCCGLQQMRTSWRLQSSC